jgi:hypothetical protein
MTSITDDLGSILDVIDQPVMALDAEHRVSYANPPAAEILGYASPSDLLGAAARPDPQLTVPAPVTLPPTEPQRALPARGRGTLSRADGSRIAVEWLLLPFLPTRATATVYVLRVGSENESPAPEASVQQPSSIAHEDTRRQRRTAEVLQHGAQERLAGVLLGLRMIQESLDTIGTPEAAELLEGAIRDAGEALAHVRQATAAIYPGVLRARGLKAALSALTARCTLAVTVACSLTGRLPDPVELHLYFLIEAALDRAARASGATEAWVRLDAGTDIVVSVIDDGSAPGRDEGSLAAIASRVAWLGGSLEIWHTPGAGSTIQAVIPMQGAFEH